MRWPKGFRSPQQATDAAIKAHAEWPGRDIHAARRPDVGDLAMSGCKSVIVWRKS